MYQMGKSGFILNTYINVNGKFVEKIYLIIKRVFEIFNDDNFYFRKL